MQPHELDEIELPPTADLYVHITKHKIRPVSVADITVQNSHVHLRDGAMMETVVGKNGEGITKGGVDTVCAFPDSSALRRL